MTPRLTYFAWIIVASAALLTGCDQPPQRLESAVEPGYVTDAWPDQLRGRTLRQNESGRIY